MDVYIYMYTKKYLKVCSIAFQSWKYINRGEDMNRMAGLPVFNVLYIKM